MAKFTSVSINIRRWANSKDKITEKLITECIPYPWEAAQKAYHYAQRCLKKRWSAGEECIIRHKCSRIAYLYAKNVIKGRWQKAESLIAQDEHSAYLYSKYILKNRFPNFEKTFFEDQRRSKSRWRSTEPLYLYARDFLKGRLPKKMENRIAENADTAATYAIHIMKKRWRAAEKRIVKAYSADTIDLYIRSLKSVKDRRDFRRLILAEALSHNSNQPWYLCAAQEWIKSNEASSDPVLF